MRNTKSGVIKGIILLYLKFNIINNKFTQTLW